MSNGKTLKILLITGFMGIAVSFIIDIERSFLNWLLWFFLILVVGLGNLFIISLEHLVGSKWNVILRRIPERLSGIIIPSIITGIIAIIGLRYTHPWFNESVNIARPNALWLNFPSFLIRLTICFVIWIIFYTIFVNSSFKQDQTGNSRITVMQRRMAGPFMIAFAITLTITAIDWLMSLEPNWYSTIFGVYVFSGAVITGLSSTILSIFYLKENGRLQEVKDDHLYNLGALLFAFSIFWAYIAYAQFLLIWYGNLPEEVVWLKERVTGQWAFIAILLLLIRFVLPFSILLSRDSKSDKKKLIFAGLLGILGEIADLYWIIFPSKYGQITFGPIEILFAIFFISSSLLWVKHSMQKGHDMPTGDPFIKEGLEFHL